jgi:hypothetical protein
MPDLDSLAQQLVQLSRRDYSDLIGRVDSARREALQREVLPPLDLWRDKASHAHWYGRSHFDADKNLIAVYYLPENAPPNEIRLLEVSRDLAIPELAPIEALDFSEKQGHLGRALFVADVTPGQFEGIRQGTVSLPPGWSMTNAQRVISVDQ